MRFILCSVVVTLCMGSLSGEALFVERFDYENGELGAASSNRWAPTTSDAQNPNLNVIEGQLGWDFTVPVADPVNNGYYGATFSQASISTGKLYAYFDMEVTEAPIGTESTAGIFFTLWNGGGGNRARTFIAAVPDGEGGIIPGRFRLGVTKQSGSRFDAVYYPIDWPEGNQLTVLIKSDFDAETVTLFVNPETETDTNVVAIDGAFLGIKGLAVRHRDESEPGNNIGVFRVDNIAITETFGDFKAPPDLAPSRLAVAGVPGGVISVNWTDNSNSETGFRVERREESFSEFQSLGVVDPNRTHFMDGFVIPGTEYVYRIVALTETELESSESGVAQIFTDPGPFSPPVVKPGNQAGNLSLDFEVSPEVIYVVEESSDLKNWGILKGFRTDSAEAQNVVLEPGELGRTFARLAASQYSVPTSSIGLTEPFQMPNNGNGSSFNLSDFGATTGDSTNDDATAFVSAFGAMSSGDILTVPAGEFHLKSSITVPSGLVVRGVEGELSILKTIGVGDAIRIASGSQDITISDLVIIGEDELLNHGVFVGESGGVAPERVWLNRIRIERFNRRAIQLRNAKHVQVEACRLLNALQLGGGGFGYGVTLNDSNNSNNWVTDCFIGPVIRHGILIQFSAHNNLVDGNTCFETTEEAYDLHGEDEYGNELRFNLAYWDGDSSTVGSPSGFGVGNTGATHDNSGTANWVHHNEVRGYQLGIEVIQGSHIVFIDGNTFTDNATTGVRIHNGSGNSVYLRGNDIRGSEFGIQATRSYGLVVNDNIIFGNDIGISTTSEIDDYKILNNDLRGNGTAKELGSDAGEFVGNLE